MRNEPDVRESTVHERTAFLARTGTSSLRGEKTRRKKLVSGITKHLSAQHDFFGADTRLGVYRALALSSSLRKIK